MFFSKYFKKRNTSNIRIGKKGTAEACFEYADRSDERKDMNFWKDFRG